MTDKRYWPFEVLSPGEQTDLHRKFIRFLEVGIQNGCKSYSQGADSLFGIEGPANRVGEIIHRGANRRWEILLAHEDKRIASKIVTDFDVAAEAVIRWIQGRDAQDCLD